MISGGLAGLCSLICVLTSHGAPSPIALVTGNGRITVALDESGALTQLSWPGPGAPQHLDDAGARWYLVDSEGPVDLYTDGWTVTQDYAAPDSLVLVTNYSENGGVRSAVQTIAAIPDLDLLLVRLRLKGFSPSIRARWTQAFLPCDQLVPGLAEAQRSIWEINGFAAGFDREAGLLEHWRPVSPGKAQWNLTRDWVRGATDADSGPGYYVGAASTNEIGQGVVCGDLAAAGWITQDPIPGVTRITGRAVGIMELIPVVSDGALEFDVLLGAADSGDGLRRTLADGVKRGVAELEALASRAGGAWGTMSQPVGGEHVLFQRSCLNLLIGFDQTSGVALRAPLLGFSAVYSDVFETAWSAAALDRLGLPDAARRALAHHIDSVRAEQAMDTPAGSLPRRVYRNGVTAFLSGNADPEGAAWLLAACWRHTASLPATERQGFLALHWPALSRCTDYLAREPRVGGTLSGALPAEAAPLDMLRTHYLGLESSRRMAEVLGEEEPGLWTDRRDEIYARLRFRTLNQSGGDDTSTPWVDWWIAQLPGAGPESGMGWGVIKSAGAPALTEEAIVEWAREESLGPRAPLALRDALRCLLLDSGS